MRPQEINPITPERRDKILPASLVGMIAAAALVSPSEVSSADTSKPVAAAEMAGLVVSVETEPPMNFQEYAAQVGNVATNAMLADRKPRQPKGPCTTIRRGKDELYLGKACRSNAVASIVDGGHPDQEWIYAAVLVDGIYKCGYIRVGTLPLTKIRQDVVNYCSAQYYPLTQQRFHVYRSINCPEILDMEGCRGAAPKKHLVLARCPETVLYTNFATAEPSVFNVLGKGRGGLSWPIVDHEGIKVGWRATTRLASKDGSAAMVHGRKWGFVDDSCINKDGKKHIGPITEFTPEQLRRIRRNKHENRKYEKLVRNRERHIKNRNRKAQQRVRTGQ